MSGVDDGTLLAWARQGDEEELSNSTGDVATELLEKTEIERQRSRESARSNRGAAVQRLKAGGRMSITRLSTAGPDRFDLAEVFAQHS